MKNLNIYYSDRCNLNCSYCIARGSLHSNNTAIQAALEDDTFAHYVRQALTEDTTSLGIWGMEPSINGKYFNKFITSILDYSPYIRYILIPTNGFSLNFYTDFIMPVLIYCTTHHRKIIMQVQFSLDGPKDLHDKYRGAGSFDRCMNSLYYILRSFPYNNKYMRLRIHTKSTLRGPELETYSIHKWFNFMYEKNAEFTGLHYERWGKDEDHIDIKPIATVEVPGNYTAAQGRILINWVEPADIPFYKTDGTYCNVGKDSKTIDYQGNLYDCHLLVNKNFDIPTLRADFEQKMTSLVAAGEAIEQDRNKLFNAIMSIYCWATANNDIPESYIKLMGNGVLL